MFWLTFQAIYGNSFIEFIWKPNVRSSLPRFINSRRIFSGLCRRKNWKVFSKYCNPFTHASRCHQLCKLSELVGLATSLRLSTRCCAPHQCQCGTAVKQLGHYGLLCNRAAGRISHHANSPGPYKRQFSSRSWAGRSATWLLVSGLTLIRGTRLSLWCGKLHASLVPLRRACGFVRAGAVANLAEDLKRCKYRAW